MRVQVDPEDEGSAETCPFSSVDDSAASPCGPCPIEGSEDEGAMMRTQTRARRDREPHLASHGSEEGVRSAVRSVRRSIGGAARKRGEVVRVEEAEEDETLCRAKILEKVATTRSLFASSLRPLLFPELVTRFYCHHGQSHLLITPSSLSPRVWGLGQARSARLDSCSFYATRTGAGRIIT